MWQAISTLLRDWHTEDAEIELKTELPGGEIHSAWHLRFGGKDYFVKCDERELLPIFTAESDQLELLSRSKTVRVPQVFAVGSDRDYSFVVMEYLPPRPLDAHNAFLLGQQLAHLHQWSDQPQFGLDFDNDLSTTPQPNAWQRRWSVFFAEQRIGWQLELAAEKGLHFGDIDTLVDMVQQRLANHQPQPSLLHGDLWSGNCALGPDGPYIRSRLLLGRPRVRFSHAADASGTAPRKSMTAISPFRLCRRVFSIVSRFISFILC